MKLSKKHRSILVIVLVVVISSLLTLVLITALVKPTNTVEAPTFTVPAEYDIPEEISNEYNIIIDKSVPQALAKLSPDETFFPFSYVLRNGELQELDLRDYESETNADEVITDIVELVSVPETAEELTTTSVTYRGQLDGLDFPDGLVIELNHPDAMPISLLLPYRFDGNKVSVGDVTFTRQVRYINQR